MVFIEEVVETPPTPPSPPPTPPSSKIKSNGVSNNANIMNKRLYGSYNWSEDIAMACDNSKSPFVLWAQSGDDILLKIDVQDAIQPRIKIGEHSIDVLTEATGASGVSIYRAHIDLLHNIVEKESSFIVLSHHIDIKLSKYSKNDWWPRLSSEKCKLPWLKIDFNRWKNEDDDEDEEEEMKAEDLRREMYGNAASAAGQGKNYAEEMDGYSSRVSAELDEADERAKRTLKNVYLTVYNAFMFIAFSYVFWSLSYRMYSKGPAVYEDSVDQMGVPMAVIQIVAWLEVVHALLGLVPSNVLATIVQQWGRSFILFFVILAHEGLAESPHVHWLFFVWSAIEIIRYPFYMVKSTEQEATKLMTWLRYSAWIPLYPAGMLLEMSVINAAIPLFELSQKYSFSLPNVWNFSFEFGTFLRGYLILYPCACIFQLWHMWEQRKKALGVGGRKGGAKKVNGVKTKRKTA